MQNHITRKRLIGPSNNVIETTGQDTATGTMTFGIGLVE